jgi:hypothetical protein
MFILLIASIIIILLLVSYLVSYYFKTPTLSPKDIYDSASPGIFLSMITLPTLVAATNSSGPLPDVDTLSLDACTKLGHISKPLNGIIDLTLLNRRLPLNFYSSRASVTNVGILLDPKPLQKFIQCMGVRDRGSDLRRCDTDFGNSSPNLPNFKFTSGDYQFPLRKTGAKCTCTFDKELSNKCSSGPSIAGCGAKCSDTGKVCGEVTWCTDFGKEPSVEGGFCAWNPNNMTEWIDATIAWNKAYLRNKVKWDVTHSENEVDAIVADTPQNQQIINDAILGFVITDSCGATKSGTLNKCPVETMGKLSEKMKAIVAQFNQMHGRSVKLYLVKNNDEEAVSAWEANGYVSDWSSFTEIPVPDYNIVPGMYQRMYTYRVADGVDGILEKNTGDMAGDNSYIGGEFCGRHPDTCQDALLTQYEVEYDATPVATPAYTKPDGTSCYTQTTDCQQIHSGFGNYSLCNPGGVVGGTGAYKCTKCADAAVISQETPCDVYPGVETDRFSGGKWYSWPGAKMCGDTDAIGTDGCRWKVSGTPKSVSVRDLVSSGYKTLDVTDYQKMQKSCKHKKSCVDKKVGAYVKENERRNMEIIKNAF